MEYHRHSIPGDGPIFIDAFFQTLVSREVELLLTFTCEVGNEDVLKNLYENAPGSNSLLPGPTADPLVRITKGWNQWPGDARAEVPLQVVMLYAFIPPSVRSVTLDLPDFPRHLSIDTERFKDASSEIEQNGWSFGYAQLGGLTLARITHYKHPHNSDSMFRVETPVTDWGAQYHSLDDRVEARFVTTSNLETLERYRVSTPL